MRDKVKGEYHGKGVKNAVNNVNTLIAPALVGKVIIHHISHRWAGQGSCSQSRII